VGQAQEKKPFGEKNSKKRRTSFDERAGEQRFQYDSKVLLTQLKEPMAKTQ
jgi:hypothetical protein